MIAPSMYIKHIWDQDPDYKVYKDQIFTNLHETHANSDQLDRIILQFYEDNHIQKPSSKTALTSQFHLLDWGIDEEQIQNEMERQEVNNQDVSLLFAMKWFYSDLNNKGNKSPLVNGLIEKNSSREIQRVKTENELLTLCYMSYLESNNYLKSDQKYLFGELVKSTDKL